MPLLCRGNKPMQNRYNMLNYKCVCPACWLAIAFVVLAVSLQLYHPNTPSAQIADWLKYYVLAGTLMTAAWMSATAPSIIRNAREVAAKEPAALFIGILLFGGAPVILLPLMVSAWPLLSLCALRHWRRCRQSVAPVPVPCHLPPSARQYSPESPAARRDWKHHRLS
jgi:hypothetical protein